MTSIASILLGGGVVLMPTDTIYGLHALANHTNAIQRIVDIKGRGEDKPFVVVGSSIEQLEELGAMFSKSTREILEQLWPGPLTAIVPLRFSIAASRGAATIAVRVPALDSFRELLEQTGPLASTSANRSGEPPIVDPKVLSREMHDAVDAIVDEGPRNGEASVIVDFTGAEPRFIREGQTFFTQKVWKTLRKSL